MMTRREIAIQDATVKHISRLHIQGEGWVTWCNQSGHHWWTDQVIHQEVVIRMLAVIPKICAHCVAEFETTWTGDLPQHYAYILVYD